MIDQSTLKSICTYDKVTGHLIKNHSVGFYKPGTPLGTLTKRGYIRAKLHIPILRNYFLHTLVWLYHYGHYPKTDIDHIDRNKSNNRIENLRVILHSANLQNVISIRKHNNSGFAGVYFHSQSKKYRSKIMINGKSIHLGTFKNPIDAHSAYLEAKSKLHPYFS